MPENGHAPAATTQLLPVNANVGLLTSGDNSAKQNNSASSNAEASNAETVQVIKQESGDGCSEPCKPGDGDGCNQPCPPKDRDDNCPPTDGKDKSKNGKGKNGKGKNRKVEICHRTGSASNPFVLISVSDNAWAAHQRHGDVKGGSA